MGSFPDLVDGRLVVEDAPDENHLDDSGHQHHDQLQCGPEMENKTIIKSKLFIV